MFSASSENATLSEETSSAGETQHPTTRRLGTRSGLFAVPEDREVLRTPQENENSGYVFGQGTSGEVENERAATPDGSEGSLTAPPVTTTAATDPEKEEEAKAEEQQEQEVAKKVSADENAEDETDEISSPPPISTTMTHDSDPGSPPARPPGRRSFSPDERSPSPRPPREEMGYDVTAEDGRSADYHRLSDNEEIDPLDPNLSHTTNGLNGTYPAGMAPLVDGFGSAVNPQGFGAGANPLAALANSNVTHYYPGPSMEEFLELDREAEQLKQEREFIAAQPLPEVHSQRESFAERVAAVKRQMSYKETTYSNSLKSWYEQTEEAERDDDRKRKSWLGAIKRSRESDDEEDALVSAAERDRRNASFQNTVKMLKEAAERYEREERAPIITADEMERILPRPFADGSYYMEPTRSEMCEIIQNCGIDALKAISNVKIGREGYGEIFFEGPMDLEGLNFEKEIEIKHGHLLLKEIEKLAGYPAIVTLHHVYKQLFADVQRQTEKELREICDQPGHQFISYDGNGNWVFKVDNLKEDD